MGSPMSSPVSRRPSGSALQTSPDKEVLKRESSSGSMVRRDSSSNTMGRESSNNNMRLSIDSADNSNHNNYSNNNINNISSINKTAVPSVNKYDTKTNSNVTAINNVSSVRTYTGHTYGKSPMRSSYSPTPYSSSSTPKPNAGRYSAENFDTQGTRISMQIPYFILDLCFNLFSLFLLRSTFLFHLHLN
jgi:hypothetical protein